MGGAGVKTTEMRLCQSTSPDKSGSGCRVMLPIGDSHEIHTDMVKTWTNAEVEAHENEQAAKLAAEIAGHADAVKVLVSDLVSTRGSLPSQRGWAVDLARELAAILELAGHED